MINKISDIQIDKEYFVTFLKERRFVRIAKIRAIINEKVDFNFGKTEVIVETIKPRQNTNFSLLFINQIGIGETKDEALANYGRFKYEDHPSFLDTDPMKTGDFVY